MKLYYDEGRNRCRLTPEGRLVDDEVCNALLEIMRRHPEMNPREFSALALGAVFDVVTEQVLAILSAEDKKG